MYKILCTNSAFTKEEIENAKVKDLELIPASGNLSKEELILALQDCDGVILNGEEYLDESILSQCPKLKVIQYFGIAYQQGVNLEAANQYKKIVLNTPKVNSYSVAEFTLGLLLTLNQKLLQHEEDNKNGRWEERMFFDLQNKTVGIIGLGHIGIPFAEILYNGFHTKILYYDIENKEEVAKRFHGECVSLERLLSESDVVSLHLPLTNETRNLIGKNELSLMKESAYLINTARAEIVDADALYEVLHNDLIAGSAFDGFYSEPVDKDSKEAKLLTLPTGKFFLTPHTGYNAVEATERLKAMSISNLDQFFHHEECHAIINKNVL